MSTSQTAGRHGDAKIDARVVLSALSISTLIVFAYISNLRVPFGRCH